MTLAATLTLKTDSSRRDQTVELVQITDLHLLADPQGRHSPRGLQVRPVKRLASGPGTADRRPSPGTLARNLPAAQRTSPEPENTLCLPAG